MLVLVLLTTVLKLCVVLAPSERIQLVDHRGPEMPASVMGEEYHRGSIAKEVLDGPLLPLLDYQFAPWLGGSLVVGLLAVPCFALLGPTLFALKLVALAFNALAVALLFLVLDGFASRRAAWIGGILLACAPPTYSLIATLSLGNHLESNALALAILYAFLRIRRSGGPTPPSAFLFGALVGFSVYFVYSLAILPAVLLGLALLGDRRLVLRPALGALVLGFAAGFSPWIAQNLSGDGGGFSLYGRSPLEHLRPSHALDRLAELLARDLPRSLGFEELAGARAAWLEYAWFAPVAVLAVLGLCLRRERGAPRFLRPGPIAAIHLAALLSILALSDLPIEPERVLECRYLVPMYPFLFLLAALGLDWVASRGGSGRIASAMATAALAAVSTAGLFALCDTSRFGSEAFGPAYANRALARFIALRYLSEPDELGAIGVRITEQRPHEVQDEIFYAMGRTLKDVSLDPRYAAEGASALRCLDALRRSVPEGFRPYFEEPYPGERVYGWKSREEFWRDYRAHRTRRSELDGAQDGS